MTLRALLACLAILLASPAWAQEPVLRATLPNGLRVVIVENRLAPVVSTALNYLVGSNDSPEGFPGTAHALEHMMFRGAAGLDKDQLSELGALLGGNYNASTAETLTQYTYTAPARDLDLVLRIEAGRMRGATITEADWLQERGAISQEVSRNLSNPGYVFQEAVQRALFEGTVYEHDALGTRPSFDATDAAHLREFYDRWYAPNNAILVIAGDVRPTEALERVQRAFADIPARPVPPHAPITAPAARAPRTIELPTSSSVRIVALAFPMPGLRSPDFAAADIMGDVLGSPRGAIQALATSGRALNARFEYQAKTDVGIGMAIAAIPAASEPGPIIAELRRILADAAAGAIPAELVEAAKRQELAQLAFSNDSVSGLARIWSRILTTSDRTSPEEAAAAYAAVTTEQVAAVARTLLSPEPAVTAILSPRRAGAPTNAGGFGAPESFATIPGQAVVLPDWAAAALAATPDADPATPPSVTTLPNGLRLIVQPERVSRTVSLYGSVRQVQTAQQPAGKDGVANLADRLMSEGTEGRGRIALQTAMDDLAADFHAGFDFRLRVQTPQFEPGLRILADALLHPAFPAAPLAVVKEALSQALAGLPQSPDFIAEQTLERALLPLGDPALRLPTPETVAPLTRDDVRAYYDAAFRPDLATVVVVGDITPDDARRLVEQSFGDWRASGPTPKIDLVPTPNSRASRARVTEPGSFQDRVILAETIGVPLEDPARYALLLGNTILGGDFSSRLYRDLRIRTGYVYSVRSALDWTRTRARHTIGFGADPANVEKARALIRQNIVDMQTTPVSEGELARAKVQVLRRLPMQRASIGAIAGLYLRLADLGLPLDSQTTAAARYQAITAEQVRAAFATWLRPDDLAQVVKGP